MLFRTFFTCLLAALAAAGFIIFTLLDRWERDEKEAADALTSYLQTLEDLERSFVEHLPIYEDHVTPAQARELRKHLLADHLGFVSKRGFKPVINDEDLRKKISAGRLTSLSEPESPSYYFYNVPKKYRYLTPEAGEGLVRLSERFQENLNRRHRFPTVKLAVSSAVRPREYQADLRRKNANATLRSSHSFGVSFDIFYDDYYVSPPLPEIHFPKAQKVAEKLRTSRGFLLGDALRRQFHAILVETLLRMQAEGKIYAIHEKKQRCYHVTVLTPVH